MSRLGITAVGCAVLFANIGTAGAGGRNGSCYEELRGPPVYENVVEQVLVHPGTRHVEQVAPLYGYQETEIQLEPTRITYRVVPARYATVRERALVTPASSGWEWRTVNGRRIWCEVRRPAVYTTVERAVLVSPERHERVVVAPRWQKVRQRVQIQAGHERIVTTAPIYRSVERPRLVDPGQTTLRRIDLRRNCR